MDWFKEELKAHWFKLLLLTVACVFSFSIITSIIDDLRHFLRKDTVQTIPNSQAPIFITPQGTTTTTAPPVYVSVTPSYTEKTTAGIKPKENPKTDPDVDFRDTTTYKFQYNGKPFEYKPVVSESTKFQNNQMVIVKESVSTINVSVPTPDSGIGLGISGNRKPVVLATKRVWGNANLWAVTDGTSGGSAIGLMYFKYK